MKVDNGVQITLLLFCCTFFINVNADATKHKCNQTKLVLCKFPENVKLQTKLYSEYVPTKFHLNVNGVLREILKYLNITQNASLCNLKINYNKQKELPNTQSLYTYIEKILKRKANKMCNSKNISILIPISNIEKPNTTTTSSIISVQPSTVNMNTSTPTTKIPQSLITSDNINDHNYDANNDIHYHNAYKSLSDTIMNVIYLDVDNVNKIMSTAKYRHYLNE